MMRFIEARDGFIKFELEEKIPLSSFVEVLCSEKTYIAQIIQVKRGGNIAIAYAKILFLYNDSLIDYDKSVPDKILEIKKLPFDMISNTFHHKTPVIAGKYIGEDTKIVLDEGFFNNSMFICIDNADSKNTLLSSLQKQSANTKKTFIVDTTGKINSDKYIAGVDFKIPLNTDALEFLYEDCLNDATGDSKLMIKSIFQELAEYSKTVDFLPFSALKTIIDDMVEKAHVFKLIVLKNKLTKYDRLGYFASTKDEAKKLEQILSAETATIDLSKLEPLFLNRYFSSIYKILNTKEHTTKVFVEISNSLNKNNLKEIITNKKIASVFVTNSKFKYIKDIKSMFSNFIIEPSFVTGEIFNSYKTFLSSMPQGSLLIDGELTNKIPMVFIPEDHVENELFDDISISESETVADEKILPNNDNAESENLITIDRTVEEDETAQAITAKSEQLIEKVSQDVEPLNSGLMVNIFTENNENHTEESAVDDNKSEDSSFENTQEFHTEVNPEINDVDTNSEGNSALAEINNRTAKNENNSIEENGISEEEEETIDITEDDIDLNIIAQNEEDITDTTSKIDSNTPNTEIAVEELNDDTILMEFDNSLHEHSDNTEVNEILENTTSDNAQVELLTQEEEEEDILSKELLDEDLEKEIVADVDSIYTSVKDETISDSDLDFIDELNSEILADDESLDSETDLINESAEPLEEEFETLEGLQDETEEIADFSEPIQESNEQISIDNTEDGTLQTKEATTPIVPVYSAEIPQEDMVMSDEVYQGDTIVHAKYGTGVVEKMIKYGTKTLYSINFDNVGRRLLDPTLTEIKKV